MAFKGNKIALPRTFQNHKVCVRPSKVGGRGVFAQVPLKKGDVIEIAPVIVIKTNEELLQHTELENYMFSDSEENTIIAFGYASMYNHKNEYKANAFWEIIGDMILIMAERNIKQGHEIFIDYGWDIETMQERGITNS